MNSFTRTLALVAAGLCWAQSTFADTSPIEFGESTWIGRGDVRLDERTHLGQDALRIQSTGFGGHALLSGQSLRHGVLDLEVADGGRRGITVLLIPTDATPEIQHQITLHPVPVLSDTPVQRLRRYVVTSGEETAVVINFHLGTELGDSEQAKSDVRQQWFRARIVLNDDLCEVFINDDVAPVAIFANLFQTCSGGCRIGIEGPTTYFSKANIQESVAAPVETSTSQQ